MIMNLTMIKSLISNKDEYSEPKTIEMLSSISFISSFIKKNGKEYLPSLLSISSITTVNEGDTIDITNSNEYILIYLTGSLLLINHSNGEELSSEHISFGLPVIISNKQRLYDKIIIKMISKCSFITVIRKEYESLLETISIEKTQKITKFTSIIKIFKLFYNIKKSLYEKLYQIAKEQSFKRKEIVYEENSVADGIYFIIKGSFLLTKNQPNETKEEELKKVDRELKYLSKEGDIYLKCLNNKFSSNSREMKEMKCKLHLLGSHTSLDRNRNIINSKSIITKSQSHIMNLTILDNANVFGDIELISQEKYRAYTVQCISEIGHVIYFPHDQFKEICTESMFDKIHIEVLKKANLFSSKYFSDIKISKRKLLLERYSKIPVDINKITLRRNFIEEIGNNDKEVKTAFKAYKTSCAKFRLPNVNGNMIMKQNITTTNRNYINDKEFSMSHLKLNSVSNDTTFQFKKEFGKINSDIQLCNVFHTKNNNQTPLTKICNTFTHNPHIMKQNYKETGIKYPFSLSKTKRKLSFHFRKNGLNLKKVLISNNISDVELVFNQLID